MTKQGTTRLSAAISGLNLFDALLQTLGEVARPYKNGDDRVTARNLVMVALIGRDPGKNIKDYREGNKNVLNANYHIRILEERGHVVLEPRNRGNGYAVKLTESGKALYRKVQRKLR